MNTKPNLQAMTLEELQNEFSYLCDCIDKHEMFPNGGRDMDWVATRNRLDANVNEVSAEIMRRATKAWEEFTKGEQI